MADGWSDDSDLDISDGDGLGWEDHHELFGINDDTAAASVSSHRDGSQVGWEDDEDLFGDSGDQLNSKMIDDISKYVKSLDRMLSSINAVLEFEYNTKKKADELVEYYMCRPQLAEYTRTKELQRMNYKVVLPHGHVETNKDRILADNLLPDKSIVSRAANQSLLADLLMVITGNDLIVQPQFFAICVATWCQFTIHVADNGADMVDCRAQLSLSLPTEVGDRLDIAQVSVSAIFSPSNRMIEFKVQKIDVLLEDFSQLVGVAEFLKAMGGHSEDHEEQELSADIYRDAFLENSQRLLSLSSKGMKSALMQMDSVVNIKGKLERISNFIPGNDQLQAAEEEARAYAENMKKRSSRPPPPPRPSISSFILGADQLLAAEEEAKAYAENMKRPFIPRTGQLLAAEQGAKVIAQQQQPNHSFPRPLQDPSVSDFESKSNIQINAESRPTSILGGFVRSGWKTLAKSVVPDDDPAIYGQSIIRPSPRPLPPSLSLSHNAIGTCEEVTSQQQREKLDSISGPPPRQTSRPNISNPASDTDFQKIRKNSFDKSVEDASTQNDGWDDFGFDEIDDAEDASTSEKLQEVTGQNEGGEVTTHSSDTVSVTVVSDTTSTTRVIPVIEVEYNPDDDIVQTRKRWVNNSSLLALKCCDYVKC